MKLSLLAVSLEGLAWWSSKQTRAVERIGRVAKSLEVDLVVLWSVGRVIDKQNFKQLFDKKWQYRVSFLPKIGRGVAIYSKYPILDKGFRGFGLGEGVGGGLLFGSFEKRGVGRVRVKKRGVQVEIVSVNIDPDKKMVGERETLTNQVVEVVTALGEIDEQVPTVVIGNFGGREDRDILNALGVLGRLDGLVVGGRENKGENELIEDDGKGFVGVDVYTKKGPQINFEKRESGVPINSGRIRLADGNYAQIKISKKHEPDKLVFDERQDLLDEKLEGFLVTQKTMAKKKMWLWSGLAMGFLVLKNLAGSVLPGVFVGVVFAMLMFVCAIGIYLGYKERGVCEDSIDKIAKRRLEWIGREVNG